MKNIYSLTILVVGLLFRQLATAQTVKTKYLSAQLKEVAAADAYYFEQVEENSLGGGIKTRYLAENNIKVKQVHYSDMNGSNGFGVQHGPAYEWYPNGQLKLEMNYHYNQWDGPYTSWYENGQINSSRKYQKNTVVDTLKVYYETGGLRRLEVYREGKMVLGEVYDEGGKAVGFIPMEVMPKFPGGEKIMLKWIAANMRYPKTTRKAKAEGLVIISFVVDEQGRIGEAELIKGIHPDADAEGLRVINAMPTWKPGLLEGKPVPVRYTLPLRFALN